MRLTTFSDYTLRVLMYLALDRTRLATIPEIAAAYDISQNHLMKVVHQLARAGVIESVRGRGGGLRLARAPEAIRIGEVVRAAEGTAPIVECLSDDPHACTIAGTCRLTHVLVDAFDALYESLDRYTLADLTRQRRALASILVTGPPQKATATANRRAAAHVRRGRAGV
ncbi:MAG: Rrf2 family transcriptional regulator [Burkholderiales bacterium]|nr:Rrf2 family transcriptional regulator [Burkholderiales bacterium]